MGEFVTFRVKLRSTKCNKQMKHKWISLKAAEQFMTRQHIYRLRKHRLGKPPILTTGPHRNVCESEIRIYMAKHRVGRPYRELSGETPVSEEKLKRKSKITKTTKSKKLRRDYGYGFALFETLETTWRILRRQIEGRWQKWAPDTAREALSILEPIKSFYDEIARRFDGNSRP
jgi:hypothetical protein